MRNYAQKLLATLAISLIPLLSIFPATARAQGTAFTYQGRLNDGGAPANGNYDFRFSLFTTNTGGSLAYGFITNSATPVSNGVFTVTIDFGSGVFDGTTYWLQIGVRTNGGSTFTSVSPRQELTPTPYAILAENVNASGINGTIPATSIAGTYGSTVNFNNGADSFDGTFSGAFYGSSFIGGNFVGNFVGTGESLSDVWHTDGNFGTTAGVNFVGTTDNQPLELHANNQRVLVLQPDNTTNVAPNLLAGSPFNNIAAGVYGSTISGGGSITASNQILGSFNTIGGGWGNVTGGTNFNVVQATIGGGVFNIASGISSTIGGGANNIAWNNDAVVAGGLMNRAGFRSDVSGGNGNTDDGTYSGIGGGYYNDIHTNVYTDFIGGGEGNIIYDNCNNSFIGGGDNNQIYGDANGNGLSAVVGGYDNIIRTNAAFSAIGGGLYNTIYGDTNDYGTGVIAGGDANTINSNSWNSFIGGGQQNSVGSSADHSTVVGGQFNAVQSASPNGTIVGGQYNNIQGNSPDSIIGGGQFNSVWTTSPNSTIGGGWDNVIQTNDLGSTIAGGLGNQIQSCTYGAGTYILDTICGGWGNIIQSNSLGSTIAGGYFNQISGYSAFIGGGLNNTNGASYGAIPGGYANYALGTYSFAAGNRAQALYSGDFVWADSQNTNFSATTSDQVSFRCLGGVRFTSGSSASFQTVSWTPGTGSWSFSSDRNLKDRFESVDARQVLDQVSRLPIVEWSYKGYPQRHIGAMAQDFHALFPLNPDDKSLNDADLHGVALAAIQGLNQKLDEKDAEIQSLKQQNETLEKRLERLEQSMKLVAEK